ncbi:putative ABC transporter ATP-binding protein [Salinivirga cyanobacteriivorans]|uniref:Putative ABC transporter ATP-binding protein n=1 Tax=Salinivirga cyanobacteriivorans TaxID=1307839 RepID=A0A0S2HXD0_9BACT|nr:ATP-binding cassette domain-containing protein [Salinivirga cyanobacteriivorans]ALO14613.1 putative ABC transporter ATP-binding protein [Salinivirga cyanobacteriivorans]
MDVELKNIELTLREQRLFNQLSLQVQNGEKVWIQAPSGSGKSTLLRMIFGFVEPDKGTINIDREPLQNANVDTLRSRIGYIAQSAPMPLMPLRRFVEEWMQFDGNRKLQISMDAVRKVFLQFNLKPGILDKQTGELSGGERQRVCFSLLTLMQRNVWLLDEVTSGLDTENSHLILEAVQQANATVVITAHDGEWDKIDLKKITLNG